MGITKSEGFNLWAKIHGNSSNSCLDLSVWTEVDQIDLHCHPQSLLGLLKININMTKNLNRINKCVFFVMAIYSVFYNSLYFFCSCQFSC